VWLFLVSTKLNNYKVMDWQLCLTDGGYHKQQVPLELKYDTIELVNCIQRDL
jgi:hypothetical protein